MTFDVAASLPRLKPQRASTPIVRRPDKDLLFVASSPSPGPELLLDTCVYIDVLQGRTPTAVDDLLQLRILNHSAVALSELTRPLGRLDPTHPGTRGALRELMAAISDIPAHRLSAPSVRATAEAGMLAGLVARLTGRAAGVELQNDAALLLHAAEIGCALLTRNLADFDPMQQIAPECSVLFYRLT